ncbi:MAG TPA: C-GCAxxG-C-C family protein [Anaerolineales bacterium]|nr:C-GCAxxG-C-C family protein [Anaerolineales bacterium]
MPSPVEFAMSVFNDNFNCSQAVFSAFASRFGVDEKTALRLASPFGGGIARQGEVCGAVTGALLAIGLGLGSDTPSGKEQTYRLADQFLQEFKKKHGSLLCRQLIESDLSTPEGWHKAKQAGKFTSVCPLLVKDAVQLVEGLLE